MTIKEVINTLQPNRAIYSLTIDHEGTYMQARHLHLPESIVDPADPLTNIVQSNRREIRDYNNRFAISQKQTLDGAWSDVRHNLLTYIKQFSPAKQATNQSVYRWVVDMHQCPNDKLLNVMVEVYRYVAKAPKTEHRKGSALSKNFMNVMELIRCQN